MLKPHFEIAYAPISQGCSQLIQRRMIVSQRAQELAEASDYTKHLKIVFLNLFLVL